MVSSIGKLVDELSVAGAKEGKIAISSQKSVQANPYDGHFSARLHSSDESQLLPMGLVVVMEDEAWRAQVMVPPMTMALRRREGGGIVTVGWFVQVPMRS